MAVSEGFEIDAQGRGLAAEPADGRVQRLADRTAFADPRWAEEEEQVQMPGSESTDIGFQLGIGVKAYGVRQHFRRGHGWGPGRRASRSSVSGPGMSLRNAGDAGGIGVARAARSWATSAPCRRGKRSGRVRSS